MGLFDGILQGVSALRMKEIEKYTTDPFEIQSEQLFWLLSKGVKTLYGKQHGFAGIDSCDTYRKVVPITTYDDLRPYIEKGLQGSMAGTNKVVCKILRYNREQKQVYSGIGVIPKPLTLQRLSRCSLHGSKPVPRERNS